MKTLLIDNYDSFTFNLFQLIAEVNRVEPLVVRNDAAPWSEIRTLAFDNIVISPGPGRPEREADFGICRDAVLEGDVPLLGVCLGHQGLCHLLGGEVDYADQVRHGRSSRIHHTGEDLFAGIPSPFDAIRYHSLVVRELPPQLEKLAWTDDGILMGVRHVARPLRGVQFHPESIGTEHGARILENFRSLTVRHLKECGGATAGGSPDGASLHARARALDVIGSTRGIGSTGRRHVWSGFGEGESGGRPLRVYHRRLPVSLDAEAVFLELYGDTRPAFWLDSAVVRGLGRFSYMGDAAGPHAEYVTYRVSEGVVRVERGGEVETSEGPFFDWLDHTLRGRRVGSDGLPFDFNLGYVGYLGYELKAECGGDRAHDAATPDAAFLFADRMVVFDHVEDIVYLVCLDHDDDEGARRAEGWLAEATRALDLVPPPPPGWRTPSAADVPLEYAHDAEAYLGLIEACKEAIRTGESYEICLTNRIRAEVRIDPLETYRALRARNPAPYAAYLGFPQLSVLSASPERFLASDRTGTVEARPIKGTRRRGATPREDAALHEDLRTSEKDISENLMIVDLLRNDLGKVCEVGSVEVRDTFAVESYATVHQLVSTVRGRLRRGVSAVEAVRAAFPGGSMTGAPKRRTLQILDRLEAGPRGVYAGALGYLALNGSADLSIVIRTIVSAGGEVSMGVGGAIVDLSEPREELEETHLKAEALVAALAETALPEQAEGPLPSVGGAS